MNNNTSKLTKNVTEASNEFQQMLNNLSSLFIIVIISLCLPRTIVGQGYTISKISINGNEVTAQRIIERELSFKVGDTISDIENNIKETKTNLINTRLFHNVDISYKKDSSLINIEISVSERWYFWPIPILEHADPILATWIRRKDFGYINYGITLNHKNFAGLNQDIKIKFRRGIREQYGITYSIPQLKLAPNSGLYFDISLFRQKEIHTQIKHYRYEDLLAKNYIYHEIRVLGGIQFRPRFFRKHYIYSGYRQITYDKSIDSLFNKPITNNNEYIVLGYVMKYFRGDYVAYPRQGVKFYTKTELGLNKQPYAFSVFKIGFHYPFTNKITLSTAVDAFASYTNNYPYFAYVGLGKSFYMRGFEDYITHNIFFAVSRYQLKYTVLNHKLFKIKQIKTAKFNTPLLSIFANLFAEIGYTQNIYNHKNQSKVPISYGLGLDFLTYYDWVSRIEACINNRNEKYINIHWGYIF